ncbi:hypothetical protein B0J13DRAFT_43942 [Dactylonectria estremocensis]|uniref:Arrestin C-terminal-like domain-containing protein n=1 Tax=Dactylonectria estremocensis TaxID=1079267 RepID=A0A9P9EUX2_9HYPO|nr:hypothetical protein B0J13DRAFT_43942 [Dactylonectria estremocensis]
MTASTDKPRRSNWITANENIFYRPRLHKKKSASLAVARFPSPLIGPRRARPQAIHIVSYPSGYIPRELRPENQPPSPPPPRQTPSLQPGNCRHNEKRRAAKARARQRAESLEDGSVTFRPLGKLLGTFSSSSTNLASSSSTASSAVNSTPSARLSAAPATAQSEVPPPPFGRATWAPATTVGSTGESVTGAPPAYDDTQPDSPTHSLTLTTTATSTTPFNSTNSNSEMAPRVIDSAIPAGLTMANPIGRLNASKSAVTSFVAEVPKPIASGSGVSCAIVLAEQNIFLSGFDHDGNRHRDSQSGTALLRGKLQLRVTKNVKIKAVQLKLLGRARTEWPEGIPPLKQVDFQEESLRTQVLTFFNAMNDGWESEYGNQCTYQLKTASHENPNSSSTSIATRFGNSNSAQSSHRNNLTAKDFKRLSLQNAQSRSFQKDESPIATATQVKGYKVFYPGVYDYSFELPIDHHQLETTKLQFGSVTWELLATVDRAGAFRPNLHGTKELSIVRVPDQLSLEMSEPISISRQWEDQLHYDIVISGKSFPIGSKIPIAFKLTPLAKVQVHKLKVFVTESIEYWTNDRRVTRKDPGRKILLLEKTAGKPLDEQWEDSNLRFLQGGEPTAEERREAREAAARRRASEAARRHTSAQPLPEPTENMLGDLDLGLEHFWGATEIEANVQIPTCEMMAKNKELRLHADCSWKNVNVYHWIKVVMRISRIDPDDPTGTKRKHFEISIDSPFTVLNCRATHANTNLPAYSGSTGPSMPCQSTCGCPDATSIRTDISPSSSTGTLSGANTSSDVLPAPPQAAHLAHNANEPRPIHLMRVPSFNPPAFDDDVAPPAHDLGRDPLRAGVMTPPPCYDAVVGTPSVDGLADYFARLADYDGPDSDSASDSDESPPRILERTGRVNVAHPMTPGGRMPSRSMEIARPPITLDMGAVTRRPARVG